MHLCNRVDTVVNERMKKKEATKKRGLKRILFRIGLGLAGFIILMMGGIAIMLNMIVTPEKITPILLDLSKDYIRGEVRCESVDITFFSTFPDLGIRLQNGSLSSESDTLLSFDSFIATIDPVAYFSRQQVIIQRIELENADIYAHIDTLGRVNWDVLKMGEMGGKGESSAFVMPELNIKSIRLSNVNLIYDDLQQDIFVMVDSLNARLRGNLSKEQANLSLNIRASGITSQYQGNIFSHEIPFSLRTSLVRDRVLKTFRIERGALQVGSLEFRTQGILQQDSLKSGADVDLTFSLNASSLKDLVKMVPEHLSDIPSKLILGGKVETNGKLSGRLGKNQYPVISISMKLIDGTLASVRYPKRPFLEDFDVDCSAFLDFSGVQPSSLKLQNLYLQTASSKLNVQGDCDDLLSKPSIQAHTKADINFSQLSQHLPVEGMTMGGQIVIDVSLQCLLDDIIAFNYGKINANGEVHVKDVQFNHEAEQITLYANNASITLGTHTKDSIGDRIIENLLRSRIVLDTLNLNYKDELEANASRLSMILSTAEPKDTAAIAPVTVGSRINNIRLVMRDSIRINGEQLSVGVNMRPRNDLPRLPEINANISMDSMRARAYNIGGFVSKANMKLKLTKLPERAARTGQPERLAQTERTERPERQRNNVSGRDSLRQSRLTPTTNLTFQLESQETKDLLRQWNISGSFTSGDMGIRTPSFPIQMRMSESDIRFTGDTLNMTKAKMRIGQSDLSLNGDIEGIRNALMYNRKITAKMTLDADSIDFNELIRAAVAGSEYALKSISEKDSISNIVLEDSDTFPLAADTTAVSGIFVIPNNLDVEFNARIRNAKYSNISIRNARGRIILRNQAIQLPRLTLNTDVGSTTVSMVYKAPDPKGAHLGVELGMRHIDLKELIGALPIIVEMAPMLTSFEGVIDCNITAVTELDSLMNVLLPETTASCYLSGQDLVLLDGETFAEISKKLMFKNKNKNRIDSMSVEMILDDEKLMIFPFQLSIDRYNVAVGGTQNLDLSFDYHITVLKSPVPFKLGLNISGMPDDMKIRLGKAKYKDMFTVAKEKDIDPTAFNLRREMDKKLRQNIQEIVSMEQIQTIRRPRMELPDSVRLNYFHLEDTIPNEP